MLRTPDARLCCRRMRRRGVPHSWQWGRRNSRHRPPPLPHLKFEPSRCRHMGCQNVYCTVHQNARPVDATYASAISIPPVWGYPNLYDDLRSYCAAHRTASRRGARDGVTTPGVLAHEAVVDATGLGRRRGPATGRCTDVPTRARRRGMRNHGGGVRHRRSRAPTPGTRTLLVAVSLV